jgi:hypothetical protein
VRPGRPGARNLDGATRRRSRADDSLVDIDVALAHGLGRERVRPTPARLGIDLPDAFHRRDHLVHVVADETGLPVDDDLIDSIITSPKGSGQSLGKSVARAPA